MADKNDSIKSELIFDNCKEKFPNEISKFFKLNKCNTKTKLNDSRKKLLVTNQEFEEEHLTPRLQIEAT